jgi:hypothetical protein
MRSYSLSLPLTALRDCTSISKTALESKKDSSIVVGAEEQAILLVAKSKVDRANSSKFFKKSSEAPNF